jgi:two-component system response regulator CpxR
MKQEILIIDDDIELCRLIEELIIPCNFKVVVTHSGVQGLSCALTRNYSLILLDVVLPEMDGFEVLKKIRRQKLTPIIMLTARGKDVDRISGLDSGADDYIAKPFNPNELVARIKAMIRRCKNEFIVENAAYIEYAGISICMITRTATSYGIKLELTSTEFGILELLIRHSHNVLSREIISETVLGRPLQRYDRSIDMHISNLRKKLAKLNHEYNIQTVRNNGYVITRTTL